MFPKWKILLSIGVVFVIGALILIDAQMQLPSIPPRKSDVNLLFKYGVGERNELNTFNNSYTKDMIIDPPITIGLYLSDAEMEQISQEMVAINFFNLSETFPLSEKLVMPSEGYYVRVQNGSMTKEVSWSTNSELNSTTENNLQQLANCITGIVEKRPEYTRLPPPNGAYC